MRGLFLDIELLQVQHWSWKWKAIKRMPGEPDFRWAFNFEGRRGGELVTLFEEKDGTWFIDDGARIMEYCVWSHDHD